MTLLSQAMQTPRNKMHGNDFKVSILCSIHPTFAPHLSQVSMVISLATEQSINRAERPIGNLGGWQH